MKVQQYDSTMVEVPIIEYWAEVQAYHPFAGHLCLYVAELVCGGFI